ncbi:hypothetical protein DMZ43_08125 [Meridianimaribacter sp. CL38]|uniref:hypothetical protein n=1 Tax=Meridianimaribacter sp. CL38 TaxID=2213021 RepID=UPI00103A0860|nr:hypothetical protein [Meridianimaribacter sp. CL38]TBV25868.1 hypothetical protein DMZ43_08125 [Meridianimaribacter sp. CL38]
MKKLFLFAAAAVLGLSNVNAQDSDNASTALSEGSMVIEINTGSWTTGSTAFSLTSIDGNTAWSAGAEAGYFVMDNLAVKAGLGYADDGFNDGIFAYKVGAKYYIDGQFPVGVDFTGVSQDGNNANWVGVQGGYAWFVAPNVSIEPTVRYNVTLDEEKAESAFQGLIGFAFHF